MLFWLQIIYPNYENSNQMCFIRTENLFGNKNGIESCNTSSDNIFNMMVVWDID